MVKQLHELTGRQKAKKQASGRGQKRASNSGFSKTNKLPETDLNRLKTLSGIAINESQLNELTTRQKGMKQGYLSTSAAGPGRGQQGPQMRSQTLKHGGAIRPDHERAEKLIKHGPRGTAAAFDKDSEMKATQKRTKSGWSNMGKQRSDKIDKDNKHLPPGTVSNLSGFRGHPSKLRGPVNKLSERFDLNDIDEGTNEKQGNKVVTLSGQMREWSNSIYKQYDDRGHTHEPPKGETVDISLRRYLNAKPHKVSIEEDIVAEKLIKEYRIFKEAGMSKK